VETTEVRAAGVTSAVATEAGTNAAAVKTKIGITEAEAANKAGIAAADAISHGSATITELQRIQSTETSASPGRRR